MAGWIQDVWWIVLIPLVLLLVFYWPGHVLIRWITGGRYPPPGGKDHNFELVALVPIVLLLILLTVYYY